MFKGVVELAAKSPMTEYARALAQLQKADEQAVHKQVVKPKDS